MPALLTLRNFEIPPLSAFSTTLHEGDRIALSGSSGCGKSRLLRALADLIPHNGEALLNGTPANNVPPAQWRRQVMLVPQETAWWDESVPAHFAEPPSRETLAELGLEASVLQQGVSALSTGQRQRLGLLRALLLDPAVLLLDEPTAHLDGESAHRVETVIERFLEPGGKALIWVSHDPAQSRRMGNRFWEIQSGQVRLRDREGAA